MTKAGGMSAGSVMTAPVRTVGLDEEVLGGLGQRLGLRGGVGQHLRRADLRLGHGRPHRVLGPVLGRVGRLQ